MARYMTTAESVSELTGTSVERSQEMLEAVPLREMSRLTAQELAQAAGLTGPQSCRLAAALALGAKLNAEGEDEEMFSKTIRCPEDIAGILAPKMEGADQEELHALYLNTRNRVTAHRMVYRGNVNSSVVRTTEVHRPAVIYNLPGLVIAHSHPSRDPEPGNEDAALTRDLNEAGKLPGSLLDHVIIGSGQRWVSMKEPNIMGGVTDVTGTPEGPVTPEPGNGRKTA